MSLYKRNSPVYQLKASDFKVDGNGVVTLSARAFKGPGAIEAYAPWCGACQNAVEKVEYLANMLNVEGLGHGAKLYVVDASSAEHLSGLISYFPTMLYINSARQVILMRDKQGNPVYPGRDVLRVLEQRYQFSQQMQRGGGLVRRRRRR